MELVAKLINTPFGNFIPVVLVIVMATLVYTFGFKSPEQPQFDKLSAFDDRKSTGKKRKLKEKKTANGHAVPVSDSKSTSKDLKRSPTKEAMPETPKKVKKQEQGPIKQADAKKQESQKSKSLEEVKNKKNKMKFEKPADYDDGNWETVPNKNDKKKKLDSPAKKDKKSKGQDNKTNDAKDKITENKEKNVDIQKFIKNEIDKQFPDNNKENKPTENVKKSIAKTEPDRKEEKEEIPQIEEAKLKKEKKVKKEKSAVKVVVTVEVADTPAEIPAKGDPENDEIQQEVVEEPGPQNKAATGAVFDELGDLWTEAKAVKKSKKKSRRD